MKILYFIILIFIFGIKDEESLAQTWLYQRDTSIKVYAYGQQQTLAWCGGFNNPQFTMGDLNNDGLQDLVVFEPFNGVRTFINNGTAGSPNYIYAPEYEVNFPPVYDYLIFADYNCDSISDLFEQGQYGFAVYKGYYNTANQLCFTFYKNLFYYDTGAGDYINVFCETGNIPAIVDVDNDGDLDFLAFDIGGNLVNQYKNMRVELGLPCDSIVVSLADECWGRFSSLGGPYLTLGCEGATGVGGSLCLFDYDMDGDYDNMGGKPGYGQSFFLLNGRIPYDPTGPDSMISEDTMWQTHGVSANLPQFSAAFNVDIDQDGKKDLLISPMMAGANSENYKCIWYYKNYSTPDTANWQFQSDTFLVDQSIDLGTAAYPALFDYNNDGLPDLFIGSDGYYQDSSGMLRSKISYYKNTSTPGNPSFTLQTKDFLNIDSFNFQGAAPATGDIDNDGKADLILGHTDGTLSYFKNMATSDSVTPDWELQEIALTDVNGDTINVDGYAAPFIYDVDKDGKNDLVIGELGGYLQYYQNVGITPGIISLKPVNMRLGNAEADARIGYGSSTPFIGPIDNTGTDYLMMGSYSGNIYQFSGIASGDTSAIYAMADSQYSFIDTTYNLYNHPSYGVYAGQRSSLTVGDIAGDGSMYMIVGNEKGGVELYKAGMSNLKAPMLSANGGGEINIYPNPATTSITIAANDAISNVVISNVLGQIVYNQSYNSLNVQVDVSEFASGVYFVQLNGCEVRKFVKE